MRLLVGCALALALAGCTGDAEREPVDRADTRPAAPTSSAVAAASTRPLVLAVNARRPPLALTERQARRGGRGRVTDWRQLGEPAGRLRTTDRTDGLRHLAMDTVAVVVADAVGPAVRVATVEGVDPLRAPAAYPIQVQGPAPGPVTTMTVVGD